VSCDIPKGSTFGIVGDRGPGKRTTVLAVMRLLKITSGSMRLGKEDIGVLEGEGLRKARRRFQMVVQDRFASLRTTWA